MSSGLSFSASLKSNVLWYWLQMKSDRSLGLTFSWLSHTGRKGAHPPRFFFFFFTPEQHFEFHLNNYSHVLLLETIAVAGFQTVVLEKTLESSLDCKEIKPVNPKGDQS